MNNCVYSCGQGSKPDAEQLSAGQRNVPTPMTSLSAPQSWVYKTTGEASIVKQREGRICFEGRKGEMYSGGGVLC